MATARRRRMTISTTTAVSANLTAGPANTTASPAGTTTAPPGTITAPGGAMTTPPSPAPTGPVPASPGFDLYDLRIEVVGPPDKPIYCGAKLGDFFELHGEMLKLPPGQGFSVYS